MARIHYTVVPHNDGYAYRLGDVFSETFASHDEALAAAQEASRRQEMAGPDEAILYQDRDGGWHEETASGDDRPQVEVDDEGVKNAQPRH